jgi:hypothetical protein
MTDLITLPRATVQQALEALKAMQSYAAAERKGLRICDESIIALKAALEQPEPPPEAQTEAEKIAYCAGWWAAMEQKREQPEQDVPETDCGNMEPVAFAYYWPPTNTLRRNPAYQLAWGPTTVWKAEVPLYTHPPRRETEPAFDALVAISLLTHLGGEVADYEDVVEAVRRLHALNGELGAALRRLISYCNTLENRLMEADGEHPAVQEAKEAWAKVEGKV